MAVRKIPYIRWRRQPGQVTITSKITSKAQTTIPQAVRAALRVGEGDEIAYRIEGDRVILTKAKREPVGDPFATFYEWSSQFGRVHMSIRSGTNSGNAAKRSRICVRFLGCRAGIQIGTIDALLAQLCLRHDLTMLTTDRDFYNIARHCGLRLWTPPA
jgi:antitoxin PrlF